MGDNSDLIETQTKDGEFHVKLPVTPDDFAGFIRGILGKGDELSTVYREPVVLTCDLVSNIRDALLYRVKSQNDSDLVSETLTISFESGKRYSLTYFDDFKSFTPIGSDEAISLVYSVEFLILFPNREHRSKETVEITFSKLQADEKIVLLGSNSEGSRHFTQTQAKTADILCRYSERTWAEDVTQLITKVLDGSSKYDLPVGKGRKNFISRNLGFFQGFGYLAIMITYLGSFALFFKGPEVDFDQNDLEPIVREIFRHVEQDLYRLMSGLVLIAVLIAICATYGVVLSRLSGGTRWPSLVFKMYEGDEGRIANRLKQDRRALRFTVLSFLGSVGASVAGAYLYEWFLGL